MFIRVLFLSVFVSFFLATTSFGFEPGNNLVGWFFDETGTQRCAENNAYETVTAYLCVKSPSISVCGGWELRTVVDGNCIVTAWNIEGGGLNVGVPPEFVVGYSEEDAPGLTDDGLFILCTASIMLLDESAS